MGLLKKRLHAEEGYSVLRGTRGFSFLGRAVELREGRISSPAPETLAGCRPKPGPGLSELMVGGGSVARFWDPGLRTQKLDPERFRKP